MNTFDLQMHSTASDGALSPAELVREAKKRGLKVISLTDHDTAAGVEEAIGAGRELGVEVIPGIEFSCMHGEKGLHILGYGIDCRDKELLRLTAAIHESRIERAREMVRRLQKQGFEIDFDKLMERAKGGAVGRPHVAFEILENPANAALLGGVKTKGEFIQNFLVPGKPAYVEHEDLNSKQAIDLIHDSGGVAVWSHPAVHFPETFEGLETVLRELAASGLEGIEVFNSGQTEAAVKFLFGLAEKYKLLRTAGSDFEMEPGAAASSDGPESIGDYSAYNLPTDDILPRLKEVIQKRRGG